jgi:hypothetical protein
MIMKVYARAKSKAALNRTLRERDLVPVREYSLLRHGIEFVLGSDVPHGTEVAIYKEIKNGFPYAHSFGTYNYNTNQVK